MKLASLAVALAFTLAPAGARAADLCDQLGRAIGMVVTGFGPAEGAPVTSGDDQYRHSTIQLSDGDNCAIEAHRILTCSWEPSTPGDLTRMVTSVAACFPNAARAEIKADPDGPPETRFRFDQASIEIGLTADVLSLDVGP